MKEVKTHPKSLAAMSVSCLLLLACTNDPSPDPGPESANQDPVAATPLHMDYDPLFYSVYCYRANTIIQSFTLDSQYTAGQTPDAFIHAHNQNAIGSSDNVFRIMLVNGLGQSYPQRQKPADGGRRSALELDK